jgi:hypothetical protein
MKAKNEKDNWMYAGKPGSTVADAVLRIFGKDLATHCEFREWGFLEEKNALGSKISPWTARASNYVISALLPKPDCGRWLISSVFPFQETQVS